MEGGREGRRGEGKENRRRWIKRGWKGHEEGND